MLVWNCSAPSPPSCHWICRGVTYRTRVWRRLVTIRGFVTSLLLNVEISLTLDYRCVRIRSHTHGGEVGWGGVGSGVEWSRGGRKVNEFLKTQNIPEFVLKHRLFREICTFARVNRKENCDRQDLRPNMCT